MIKSVRQKKIIEIISSQSIETQEQLASALGQLGFAVTQATVSRDIKYLGLIKIPDEKNISIYALPADRSAPGGEERLKRLILESVQKIDFSENIVVVKTAPGYAQGVAGALDQAQWPGIIGTVAGDDTILMVLKTKDAVKDVMKRFREISGG